MADPITPPPELVRHWSRFQGDTDPEALWFRIAAEAAQWGADMELEACCAWLDQKVLLQHQSDVVPALRAARRPKPPSLVQRALHILGTHGNLSCAEHDTIRRALEALPDD
jgi:hypothetical protein